MTSSPSGVPSRRSRVEWPFGAEAEPRRRVRLRVEVDDEAALAGLGETRGEVDGGRGLADAALLVRDRVDPGGHTLTVACPAKPPVSRVARPAPDRTSGRRGARLGERSLLRDARPAGKPGGVGPDLAEDERSRPGGARRAAARRFPARRADADRGPERSGRPRARRRRPRARAGGTTRPQPAGRRAPSRPRRRTSRAAAPRHAPRRRAGSGARRSTRSRKSHFRRSASSSVTSRSGSDAASGIPGVPPPEPTSTIGPCSRPTRSTPRSASSSSTRRRLAEVAERREAGRRHDGREPAVEEGARSRHGVGTAARPRARPVSVDGSAGGRRRSGGARRLRSPSRPRGRPSAPRGRSCARPRSSARARRAGRSPTPAPRCAGRARRASPPGERGNRPRRRRSVVRSSPTARCASAFARYCRASIIWPWRPMRTPRSWPETRRDDLVLVLDDVHRGGHAERGERPLEQRAGDAGLGRLVGRGGAGGSPAPAARRSRAPVPACSRHRAGRVRLRSATWNRTASRSMPGRELLELTERRPLRLADGLAGRLDARASSLTAACRLRSASASRGAAARP